MRSALVFGILIAGCARDAGVPIRPLPPLVAQQPQTAPLAAAALLLDPGEQLIWEVHWKGVTIGRIELAVTGDEVHSRFATGALASSVTAIRHELATTLDRAHALPRSQHETLTVDGAARTIDAAFSSAGAAITEGAARHSLAGARMHTLHSALGALRAWARLGAAPGVLTALFAGEPLRLDVEAPVAESLLDRDTLRITARAKTGADAAVITVWLADDAARAPLRIEISNGDTRATAELISIEKT